MLIIITSPYFVAGYDTDTGNIAPIIRYMKGWSIERIKSYCLFKHWTIQIIESK